MKIKKKTLDLLMESHPQQVDHENNDESSSPGDDLLDDSLQSGSSERHTTRAEAPMNLAGRETKAVWSLRLLVILVLVASTIGVAIVTYQYTRKVETALFEDTFEDDALKILESLGSSLDKAIAGIDAYVISMVSVLAIGCIIVRCGLSFRFNLVNVSFAGTIPIGSEPQLSYARDHNQTWP